MSEAAAGITEPVDDEGDVTPEPDTDDGAGRGGHLVAVVTGASRGIGRAVAMALEDAGWVVERGSSTVAPVTDREALAAWVADIVERQGRIDLLVNNAGVIDAEVDLFASDPDQWWYTHEVNVLGVYLMTWLVAPHLVAAGGGRVVNVNSGSARRAGAVASAYSASKAALARITGSAHLAGWDRGIRAFDLMPGVVRTDMTAAMDAHVGRTEWTSPEEVTSLVLALASGDLDAFSGRFVRAGVDTPDSLRAMAERGLEPGERMLDLVLRDDDPLA
ncbi:SDR family NAD(P)-dependent oxidoreductase [uncultured Phycicoccus sp.]|uniref:SDR family NAD(P)-dependent oxidoreductase n=1 Tax=uncultured Phycicoccus sp. TaxID=661422 RepID=UPI0026313F33|nr:SDR family oxidoreductase [uncultured Phycicoccus sp.]